MLFLPRKTGKCQNSMKDFAPFTFDTETERKHFLLSDITICPNLVHEEHIPVNNSVKQNNQSHLLQIAKCTEISKIIRLHFRVNNLNTNL
jgi:hypothetical protein